MTDRQLDRKGRRLVKLLLAVVATVTLIMVTVTGSWAIAFDGGALAAVVAVIWAIGGVILFGTLLRALTTSDLAT